MLLVKQLGVPNKERFLTLFSCMICQDLYPIGLAGLADAGGVVCQFTGGVKEWRNGKDDLWLPVLFWY